MQLLSELSYPFYNFVNPHFVWFMPFLSFKGITQAYLIKTIKHKKGIPLLYLSIRCTLARSIPQILSIKEVKEELALCFLNFLKMGLCSSSANCWFFLTILLAPVPAKRADPYNWR